MTKIKNMKELVRTGIIILFIYGLFVLYLLFVSDRVEKLDNNSNHNSVAVSLKVGE